MQTRLFCRFWTSSHNAAQTYSNFFIFCFVGKATFALPLFWAVLISCAFFFLEWKRNDAISRAVLLVFVDLRLPQIKNLEGKRWIVGFQIMKWTKKLWASYTLSQKSELPDVFKSLFSKPRSFHPYIFVQIHWPSWMRHFVFPFCKDATNFFNE